MNSSTCPHCGSPVASDVNRCTVCGAAILTTLIAPVAPTPPVAPITPPDPPQTTAPPTPDTPPLNTPPSAPHPERPASPSPYIPASTYTSPDPQPPQTYVPYGYAPQQPAYQPQQPGYPAYPQGAIYPPAYPYAAPYQPYQPYQPIYYPVAVAPRRAPGEINALVISWIVTIAGGISILCGFLGSLLLLVAAAIGSFDSLSTLGDILGFCLAPLVGGSFAIFFGIRGIQRKPSPRFAFPHPLYLLALTALVFLAAIILWNVNASPGPAVLALPFIILCVALPPLTLLAFAARRLRYPTSQRHIIMSLIYGSTLAALAALILNTLGQVVISLFIFATQPGIGSTNLTNPNGQNLAQIIATLALISLVAPLVEEGVKPLGALMMMPRLRSPAGAFLTGMAAGVGFSIFETLSIYIGQGQADWIVVAIERFGAGFLHGVGAGMGALGWWYIVNGKGSNRRWLKGFGALLYAVVQHGLYNALALIVALPSPISKLLQQQVYLFHLPVDVFTLIFILYWAGIVAVLVAVTRRLVRIPAKPFATPPSPFSSYSPTAPAPVATPPLAAPAMVNSTASTIESALS